MTDSKQNPASCTSRAEKDQPQYSIESKTEMEKLDRQAAHEYVPMDVFVDQKTLKEHFQASSIYERWVRLH